MRRVLGRFPPYARQAGHINRYAYSTSGDRRRKVVPMELNYIKAGDYLLPDIQLSDPPDAPPLGKYGMMHKTYLKKHKRSLYNQLLASEMLYPLCREIDEAAATRLATIPDREVAHEVILAELVYD